MATLGSRLRDLRQERQLSLEETARLLNLSFSSLAMYERGERTPSADRLEQLADFFGVSIDYLLGRSDDPTLAGAKPKPAQHTNEEFRAFLRGRKLSDRDIELILQLEERMRRESEEKKKGQE